MSSKVAASVAFAMLLGSVNAVAAIRNSEYRWPVLPPLSIGRADYTGHPATGDNQLGLSRPLINVRASEGVVGRVSRRLGLIAWTRALQASSRNHEMQIERLDRHPIDIEPGGEMEQLLHHPELGAQVRVSVSPVPLPAGAWLLASGLLGLVFLRHHVHSSRVGAG
jgi:hypothetical protein